MGSQTATQTQGSRQPAPNPIASFVPMIFVVAVIYFLLIRPQQRAAKALREQVDTLKVGDKVLINGIYGEVAAIRGEVIQIKLAEGKMDVTRAAITQIVTPPQQNSVPVEKIS
jgi:preprotein translocase subunit YajC